MAASMADIVINDTKTAQILGSKTSTVQKTDKISDKVIKPLIGQKRTHE